MPKQNQNFLLRLQELGLDRLLPALNAARRQSLRLRAANPCEDAVSRLGGNPNLPAGIDWPANSEGQPLAFLAQLDLAALPGLDGLDLPRQGALFFFYDNANQPWGFDPADAGSARVIFSASGLASSHLRHQPSDDEQTAPFPAVSLEANLEPSFPALDGTLIEQFQIIEEEFEAYLDVTDSQTPVHRMGGFPDEIQGEVALEAQLVSNGIYCGDGDGYSEGEARGLNAGAADWLLLLQLDSEERAGMMWGDVGRLYFMIHKANLASRRFDKVWTILQCS